MNDAPAWAKTSHILDCVSVIEQLHTEEGVWKGMGEGFTLFTPEDWRVGLRYLGRKGFDLFTSVDCTDSGVMVLALLAMLQASDWLYASAVDDTVTIDVNDSEDGSEAFSENAESVSPLSLAMSLHDPCLVRNWPCMKSWLWSEGRLWRNARLWLISEARASNSAWARSLPLSRCSSLARPRGGSCGRL